jgi:predicted thioesterase
MTIEATAELVKVDGRSLTFRVEAHDGSEPIGAGTHTRVVVDRARFEARLSAKASNRT